MGTKTSKIVSGSGSGEESIILVSEDAVEKHHAQIPVDTTPKTIARIAYELLSENSYRFTEEEFHHELHIGIRKRPDLKIQSYNIKRSPLLQRYGWGIHRNKEGKLALIGVDDSMYTHLQNTIKTELAWRCKRV